MVKSNLHYIRDQIFCYCEVLKAHLPQCDAPAVMMINDVLHGKKSVWFFPIEMTHMHVQDYITNHFLSFLCGYIFHLHGKPVGYHMSA